MKVAIACEASSFLLKEEVEKRIEAMGHEVLDVGQHRQDENILYFEAAQKLAEVIQSGQCEKGIVICGTGCKLGYGRRNGRKIPCGKMVRGLYRAAPPE